MEQTKNLNLNRWAPEDFVRLTQINQNFDKIDEEVGALRRATQTAGNCRIVTGSYVGTGKYGNIQNQLNFEKPPLALFISGYGYTLVAVAGSYSAFSMSQNGSSVGISITWNDDGTVRWSANGNEYYQMNGNSITYTYFALLN